jgi:hypothetical protein
VQRAALLLDVRRAAEDVAGQLSGGAILTHALLQDSLAVATHHSPAGCKGQIFLFLESTLPSLMIALRELVPSGPQLLELQPKIGKGDLWKSLAQMMISLERSDQRLKLFGAPRCMSRSVVT